MAKTPANEIFSTLKTYFNQLSEGERTPTEVASAFNEWARESAESVRAKIAEEVEATVSKMGFIKREEYELLLQRVSALESSRQPKKTAESATKKTTAKKAALKESVGKTTVRKAAAAKNVKKAPTKKASK
jgi:BMFP domain-containing protein YqiC